jgi:para-aminobenzoate synthetase component 1
MSLARGVCAQPFSAALVSGGGLDCAAHSILAWQPLVSFWSKGSRLGLRGPGGEWEGRGDPLDFLDRVLATTTPDFPLLAPPFSGGAVGYLAYELKNQIERLPQRAADDFGLPEMFMFIPGRILVHDRAERRLIALALGWEGQAAPAPRIPAPAPLFKEALRVGRTHSNFGHHEYLQAVARVREYIAAGDIYQVNLSQRFSFDLRGPSFALWERLLAANPAPFYAFINAGSHEILSTSMERFLARRESHLETRPIKGTSPRGSTPAQDQAARADLARDPKEDAELSMIVDLLRNDLGRVCLPRSIQVAAHKRLESYQNVHHLVSVVTGQLPARVSHGQILRATFPGGSITGCPKIRAMEIIDEMEPNVRHVYTGSLGYLGWHENLDLSIAIRTALRLGQKCHFAVGGGIVYDSGEEAEYQETLHKGRTLFGVLQELAKETG